MGDHGNQFARAFLEKRYRERYLIEKGIPREDLWHVLAGRLDSRKVVKLPSNVHSHAHVLCEWGSPLHRSRTRETRCKGPRRRPAQAS